jgi:hypothetical protein
MNQRILSLLVCLLASMKLIKTVILITPIQNTAVRIVSESQHNEHSQPVLKPEILTF